MSKKIMLMSSSLDGRLLRAVKKARELGLWTVACVRPEDDCAAAGADSCYAVDANDIDKLLEIAKSEEIDGVLGLWDKTVMAAAIIAKELGLPGNSPESVRKLLEKGSFRTLQKEAGVFCPEHFVTDSREKLEEICTTLHFPVILKPEMSSSSSGMTTVYDTEDMIPAFAKASNVSRNKAVCVEEYIEQRNPLQVLEADIFLLEDDILWDGLSWSLRFPEVPLRPVLNVLPATLDAEQRYEFESAVKKLLKASKVRIGEFNVEGFFTKEGRFFVIEINPRPAGYLAQLECELSYGVDYTRLLVTTAVGDMSYYEELKSYKRKSNYVLSYAIFSFTAGIFDHVHIDDSLKKSLVIYQSTEVGIRGTYIEDIYTQQRPVGLSIFRFSSEEELMKASKNIRELVYVVLNSYTKNKNSADTISN